VDAGNATVEAIQAAATRVMKQKNTATSLTHFAEAGREK
jgi:hypothetical protein